MSTAREIIDGPTANNNSGLKLDWAKLRRKIHMNYRAGLDWAAVGKKLGTGIGWWLVTTAIVTALPLVIEYNREFAAEEIERLQVMDAIENQGISPAQLRAQGLASAVAPAVLKSEE